MVKQSSVELVFGRRRHRRGPVLISNVPHKETQALVLHCLVLDLDDHLDRHCFCTIRLVRTCHPHCCSLLSTRSCVLHSCILSATFLTASSFAFLASLSLALSWLCSFSVCYLALHLIDFSSINLFHCASLASWYCLLLPATSHPSQSRVWGSSFCLLFEQPTEFFDSRDRSLWLFAAHVSILHCAVSPQRSSALCCIHLSSLRLLAVLVSARPAPFVKRLRALHVNLLFTTVFR